MGQKNSLFQLCLGHLHNQPFHGIQRFVDCRMLKSLVASFIILSPSGINLPLAHSIMAIAEPRFSLRARLNSGSLDAGIKGLLKLAVIKQHRGLQHGAFDVIFLAHCAYRSAAACGVLTCRCWPDWLPDCCRR